MDLCTVEVLECLVQKNLCDRESVKVVFHLYVGHITMLNDDSCPSI